ncbi:MAG: penicillin-binding protein activator [Fibromonadaceae bacterium]|jgi:ABC-type branched-subunit amino acid transport system substrate-binding protein|nr:penicillin-binding protein activator [Fibromonadaceae bacterium]
MRFIIFLSVFVSLAFAAPTYNELAKKIQAGDFAGANSGLETFVKGRWKVGEQEKAVVLYIESCIRLGKLKEAHNYSDMFLDFFPKSQYRARVEIAMAVVQILNKDSYSGAETLRRVLTYTKNPAAAARARELLHKVLSINLLSANELQNLLEKGIADRQIRGLAQLNLGQKMQKENRYKAANYWYYEAKKTDTTLMETADRLKSTLEGKGAGNPVILVLVPLSGVNSELGNYMVQGVMLYADSLTNKAIIRIVDDRAEPSTALRKVKQALVQDSVIAVIGPLLSASAATVAAWMSERTPHIPLITPTATEDGIARMGKNIFQLNVSTAKLASSIAEYAMNCLQINEFAIMSPNNDYGVLMANEFQRTVERKGGVILAIQSYAEGMPDYQSEFKLLIDRKMVIDKRRSALSKEVKPPPTNPRAKEEEDLNYPAVFIPSTNSKDAGLMVAQTLFNKLKVGHLLGSSGWYGKEFLLNAKKQAENSVFSVALVSNDENKKSFSEGFKRRWQREPDESKIAGLSYDAIRIINSVLNGETDPLPTRILRKKEYNGVYGKIKFTDYGTNESVNIIAVEQGKLVEKSPSCEEAKP